MGGGYAREVLEYLDTSRPWHDGVHPVDLFQKRTRPPEFDAPAWPEKVAELALDIGARVGGDPQIAAWSMLVMVAGIAPDAIKITPKQHDDTWTESARLWAALVAAPGAKKSPMQRPILAPVHAAQAAMTEEYLRERETYEPLRKRWERAAAKDPDTAGDPPTAPRHERLVVEDATLEAMTDILADNPAGLASVHDELAAQIGSWDAYRDNGSGKDRAHWLKLKEGGPHYVDRVRRGHGHVPNWSSSLLGNIQPTRIADIDRRQNLAADGMLQRFILVPARDAVPGIDRSPNRAAAAWWSSMVDILIDLRRSSSERPMTVRIADDAAADMRALMVRADGLAMNPGLDEGLQSHLLKLPGEIARLVLIYHLIAQCTAAMTRSEPVDVLVSFPVSSATVQAVRRLVMGSIVPGLVHFYETILGRKGRDPLMMRVAEAVLTHQERHITARQLYRSIQGVDREKLLGAAEDLELAGWIQPMEGTRRNQIVWEIHPALPELYRAQKMAAWYRRAMAFEAIQNTTAEKWPIEDGDSDDANPVDN